MYAVIETGGKQYRVQPGDFIEIEKLSGEVGSSIRFEQVLFASKPASQADQPSQTWIGSPYLSSASVEGEIVGQGRGEKVLIIKMKRRKGYRKTQGHRQNLTQILVTSLDVGSGEKTALSAEDKKKKLSSYVTSLVPKGGFVDEASSSESAEASAGEGTAPAKKTARKSAPRKTASKATKKSK